MNPKVDQFISKAKKWQEEYTVLREIVLEFPLIEEFKWWQPVYTWEGNNVAIIGGFKEYCVLSFFKGALINDVYNLLQFPGPNSQSAKILKFFTVVEIREKEAMIREYLTNAIENEKSGLKVVFKKSSEFELPIELTRKFEEMPALQQAFKSLTPGRQRAYILHFSQAKQSQTRVARIEKHIAQILAGKGLND